MLCARSHPWVYPALVVCAIFAIYLVPSARGNDSDFFEKKIRPLLVDKCYSCHSAKARKLRGDLLLDSRQGILKGGKDGPVLVPGDPEHSKLIEAVRWTNEDLKMPPKDRLTPEQVADLVEWVKQGAPDPRIDPVTVPGAALDFATARKQWAFHAPQEPFIPPVSRKEWCKSPIDRFILAKLEEKGLSPAPPAEKRTLLRRAYFDLVGLPPTQEAVNAFLNDSSPEAFAKVIDGLLARPQYGERWARHWLDVVRYTDSFDGRGVGSAGDCADAWRYRDWVVNAFNHDLPYDQFITQQVAGDLLPGKDGAFNADGLIATGVYVIGNWPGGDADRKKMLSDIADDQVDVTGRAFLGLTLACARCHDHKFDPIPTADYYGLAGIFLSTHFMPGQGSPASGGPLLHFPLASPQELALRKPLEDQIAALQKRITLFKDDISTAQRREMLPQVAQYLEAVADYRKLPADSSRPMPADFATERKLDSKIFSRWLDYVNPYFAQEANRTLLTTPRHNVRGISGLDGWTGPLDQPPSMLANANDRIIAFGTLTIPPRCVTVHPGQRSGVAVGWQSPVTGSVSVRGRVIDADGVCGNGIDWEIDSMSGKTSRRLTSGSFPNGGRQEFSAGEGAVALNLVNVKAGDFIQVDVYPKGDYSCDTTVVELDIIEHDGPKRVWNLAHDILGDVLVDGKGNPHADSFGNTDVWQFYEIPDESPKSSLAADSSLRKWIEATGSHDPAHVSAASTAVRDTLVALGVQDEMLRKEGKDASSLTGPDAEIYRGLISSASPFAKQSKDKKDDLLSPEQQKQLAEMKQTLQTLQKQVTPPAVCEALTEGGVPDGMYAGMQDTRIHIRGRYDRLGDPVPRHFPRLLTGDAQPSISQGSGRLQLAQFLSSANNPLTARVLVNRLWQHHFDEGIVRTPNNFGKLGRPPTHPELLDWLALEFVRQGWSIKAMQREIMLSATYQQSSIADPATLKADPDDMLFGYVKRRRLEAEAIRDSLLSQAGTLDETVGGPSIRDLNKHRRTLYLMTIRSERSDYRTLFDAADASSIVDQRIDSTVAPQALFLLNNPFVMEQAKAIAGRVQKQKLASDRESISWLYRQLYSREATEKEIEIGLAILADSQKPGDGIAPLSHEAAWEAYCQVLVCANEFVYVD